MPIDPAARPDGIGSAGSAQESVRAPRELMLASAGTGKTFHLSSQVLGLMLAGAPPDSILATTFTRKAAGEILDRILLRLARAVVEDEGLAELAEHAVLEGGEPLSREGAGILLCRLASAIHCVQVSTLDAFFHRVVRVFSLELGLIPGWSVVDEGGAAPLVDAAVTGLFERLGDDEVGELLRLLHPGEVRRRVHEAILDVVGELQRMVRNLDPSVENPWGFGRPFGDPVSPSDLDALASRVAELEVPLTRTGSPRVHWANAQGALIDGLLAGDWEAVYCGKLPCTTFTSSDAAFSGVPVPAEWTALLEQVADVARRDLAPRLQMRISALGRLAHAFDESYREAQHRRGVYRFEDIPHLLLEGGELGMGDALYYRMDARIRHLLLDEFQDTSALQWRALEPLAGEILSGHEGNRAGVVVADPKQSIYGWRGAEPELTALLAARYALPVGHLSKSWRTGSPILNAVNRIFDGLARSQSLRDDEREVAVRWARTFTKHEAARPERPGYLRVVAGPPSDHRRAVRPPLFRVAVAEVRDIRSSAPGASIGVLCRTQAGVTRMTFELERADIPVSEEGGGPVVDAWGVHLILAGLRIADRAGDRISRYLVAASPLGRSLDFTDWNSDVAADRLSTRVRSRLLEEGYGVVLDRWATSLAPHLSERDRLRMDQLVELGFRHDGEGGSLRPLDFVERVRTTRVESPGEEAVRVMTVHASKGLEFDAVVLPELEATWGSRRGGGGSRRAGLAFPVRETPDGPIRRILPNVSGRLRPLFPEVEGAAQAVRASEFRDDLSTLYVALTRPRYALHIVVEAGREEKPTPARLIREGLGIDPGGTAVLSDRRTLMLEEGNARWMHHPSVRPADSGGQQEIRAPESVAFRNGRRSRGLPRKSPSELVDSQGAGTRVEDLLHPGGATARMRGTVAHAWLEAIEWLEVGVPDDAALREIAKQVAPRWKGAEVLIPHFRRWLEEPTLRAVLSREEFEPGTVAVRELPFLFRAGDSLTSGRVDRVLLTPGADGRPQRALVVDFKTESPADSRGIPPHDERYRSQMDAYRNAVAHRYRLTLDQVAGRFVVLQDRLT